MKHMGPGRGWSMMSLRRLLAVLAIAVLAAVSAFVPAVADPVADFLALQADQDLHPRRDGVRTRGGARWERVSGNVAFALPYR
jgi:hypothetical protein